MGAIGLGTGLMILIGILGMLRAVEWVAKNLLGLQE